MIKSFISFFIEESLYTNRGAAAPGYAKKYFSPENETEMTLRRTHSGIPEGSTVTVTGHMQDESGKYHAIVTHQGKTVNIPFSHFKRNPSSDPSKVERGYHAAFNKILNDAKKSTGQNHVPIKLPNGNVINATKLERVKGFNKADFILHGKGGQRFYISHKHGSEPTDFHQLGGVTHASAANTTAVQDVVRHVRGIHNDPNGNGRLPGTVARPLNRSDDEDNLLLHQAAFGKDYRKPKEGETPEPFGVNNVHALMQGELKLEKPKEATEPHVLKATNVWLNGELPASFQGEVQAMNRSDRSNLGLNQTRIVVDVKGSRSIRHYVPNSKLPQTTE